ncbi:MULTISPECIES: hypothetical protein [unclassified Arsukibacterium]|uniref:hypothetical protein n=1 Tax=unclassified Arsukibacterium TaxID=2635278 RepID=UPI000C400B51|nr:MULTISPECIES: hypothetical protein [unclassified Arsukibacterium]MAA95081.1 hypothetical protein [Rheinheimera sp.]MBM34690.1 hypothetical protein [Rheinheimera sp.]HAW93001.1 hypothetical protein [Candidatus Azambacteria bacterium]|tara:strand:- start:1159 stop:1722 length:564 start_codon:yes stop_codon:yes gene_type:complete
MKYKVSLLATTLCLAMNSAYAQDLKQELQREIQTQVAEKPSMTIKNGQSAKYGMYQLQPELVAVPQALAYGDSRHFVGSMSLVNRGQETDVEQMLEFRRNAVVRNNMTGEMGVITGNISVLGKSGSDIRDLLQQFNLKVVRAASSTGVYILQPVNDVELVTLLAQINASGLVRTARLDILERKNTNQ